VQMQCFQSLSRTASTSDRRDFAFKPSVGSWILFVPSGTWKSRLPAAACAVVGVTAGGCAPKVLESCGASDLASKRSNGDGSFQSKVGTVAFTRKDVLGFRKLPSVGSWLQLRIVEGTSELAVSASPWTAEFEARFEDFSSMVASSPLTPIKPRCLDSGAMADLFRLAPPPSPVAEICVGGAPGIGAEVVVVEALVSDIRPEVPRALGGGTAALAHEELLGTDRAEDGLDISLLGNDAVSRSGARIAHDGVDSPSDSEDEAPSPATQARTAVVQPCEPPLLGAMDDPEPCTSKSAAGPSPVLETAARDTELPPAPAPVVPAAAPSPLGELQHLPVPRASSQLAAAYAVQAGSPAKPASAQPAAQRQQQAQQVQQPSMKQSAATSGAVDMDSLVVSALDRFFGDSQVWPQVEHEVRDSRKQHAANGGGERRFRVQVPKPYPGVQYRKSKNLDDRYMRHAAHGSIVVGIVEDDGAWLRTSGNQFLPMRVGAVEILEPLPESKECNAPQRSAPVPPADPGVFSWFSCCFASPATDAELVVGQASEWGGAEDAQGRLGNATGGHGAAAGAAHASGHTAAVSCSAAVNRHEALARGQRLHPEPSESACGLSSLDADGGHFTEPINPFADTDRTHGAEKRPRRAGSSFSPNGRHRDGSSSNGLAGRAEEYSANDVFCS